MIGSGLESPLHLLVLFIIAFLLLGPKRLPQLARSMGHGLRELRETLSGIGSDTDRDDVVESAPMPPPEPIEPVQTAGAAELSPGSNGAEPTRRELYARACELAIKGRSRMSKAELRRAIEGD